MAPLFFIHHDSPSNIAEYSWERTGVWTQRGIANCTAISEKLGSSRRHKLCSHAQKNMSCVSAVWSYCDCGPIGGSHWWLFFNKLFYLSGRNVLKTNTPELQCPAAGHTSCNHSSSIRSGPTLTLSLQISVWAQTSVLKQIQVAQVKSNPWPPRPSQQRQAQS